MTELSEAALALQARLEREYDPNVSDPEARMRAERTLRRTPKHDPRASLSTARDRHVSARVAALDAAQARVLRTAVTGHQAAARAQMGADASSVNVAAAASRAAVAAGVYSATKSPDELTTQAINEIARERPWLFDGAPPASPSVPAPVREAPRTARRALTADELYALRYLSIALLLPDLSEGVVAARLERDLREQVALEPNHARAVASLASASTKPVAALAGFLATRIDPDKLVDVAERVFATMTTRPDVVARGAERRARAAARGVK